MLVAYLLLVLEPGREYSCPSRITSSKGELGTGCWWWYTPLIPALGRQRQAGSLWVQGQPDLQELVTGQLVLLHRETLSQTKIKQTKQNKTKTRTGSPSTSSCQMPMVPSIVKVINALPLPRLLSWCLTWACTGLGFAVISCCSSIYASALSCQEMSFLAVIHHLISITWGSLLPSGLFWQRSPRFGRVWNTNAPFRSKHSSVSC